MRSVPRISFDVNQINRPDPELELFFEEQKPRSSFFATRRDFLYTKFIEDPQLVLKRQKELEEEQQNNFKEKQNIKKSTTPSTSSSLISRTPTSPISPPPTPSPPPSPKRKIKKIQNCPAEVEPRPIKKLTRSEINQVVDRLISTNDNITSSIRNKYVKDESSPIRKKRNYEDSEAVFERLYYESTKPQEEVKKKLDNNQNCDFVIQESDTEILTKSIALQKIKEMIDASFPDKQGLTFKELNDIFIRLGILDRCEKIERIPQISYMMEKWKIRNTDLYDSNLIKNILIQSIIGRKGKFKHFARERMVSALANRKNNENNISNQQIFYSDQNQFQIEHSKRLTQETFDRLLSPRPVFSSPKNEEEEDLNDIHFELSPQTQKIINKSKYANSTLEERDRELTEKAMAKIDEIRKNMEKERIKMQKIHHAPAPRISPKERAKIEELKLKRQQDLENETKQTFKPEIIKYSDFLQIKETMIEEKEKPQGIDSFISRMKKGYEQHLKKKFDEENIRSLPQLPFKRRAASEAKNEKKKEKEQPHEEKIEPPEIPEINEDHNDQNINEKMMKKAQPNQKHNITQLNKKSQKNASSKAPIEKNQLHNKVNKMSKNNKETKSKTTGRINPK
ncbi:hypothetical protein M9Y10_029182 [Tritrichomonas musculus]|uniref:CDT1 Geminin-binding domain-containing protein n=1 Tax=Tritrichomonas musculus TaxID=1915356 RepID=A0ABR2KLF0_9EUKA